MRENNILFNIKTSYSQFTKAEKKVADFVISSPEKVLFMSITDVADECGVAEASVYRFCRTMKAKGYQEFKMNLSFCLSKRGAQSAPDQNVGAVNGSSLLADKVLANHINALNATRQLVVPSQIEKVVEMIHGAEMVSFFGIGHSLLTAREANNKFLRITGKTSCIEDSHMQAMSAAMMTEKDVMIILSYSGATKDTVYVAEIAKEAGGGILGITRFRKKALAVYADEILLCGADEAPLDGGSLGVKMSQLYVVDLLFQEYFHKYHDESEENLKKTSKAVVEKLY